MSSINLNCDLGESFGNYRIGMDEEVLPFISSANVACGYHASDPVVMDKTIAMAEKFHVEAGAHPGFPDLQGFGRRNMDLSPMEVKDMILYQIGALDAFCKVHNTRLSHVKPHGALYNMAAKDAALSMAVCEAIKAFDPKIILLGKYQSEMITAAKAVGLSYANEVFADRAYEADGSLVSRKKEGAVITDEDEIIKRVLRMVTCHEVVAIDGTVIPLFPDSICVHGDNPKAVEFVKKLKETFLKEKIEIVPLCKVCHKG